MLLSAGPRTVSSADRVNSRASGTADHIRTTGSRAAREPVVFSPPGLVKHAAAASAALGRSRLLGEREVEFAVLGTDQERFPLGTGVDVRCLAAVLGVAHGHAATA